MKMGQRSEFRFQLSDADAFLRTNMISVLVIEDNPEMSENISGILELANYKVLRAENGKVGVEMALQHKPDLILCDIMMPVLDGYGVLHILSNDSTTRDIPFILLTAFGDDADFRRGMNLGADDFIVKPFDGLELLNTIEMRLRKKQYILEMASKERKHPPKLMSVPADISLPFDHTQPRRTYRKKEIVFIEGKRSSEMFSIYKGKIKTYKSNSQGKELVTGLHRPGEFIGFVPFFKDSVNHESAVALEDSEVYIIQKEEFFRMLLSNPDLTWKFLQILSSSLMETQKRLLEVAYYTVRQRVASTLLRIFEMYDKPKTDEVVITEARKDLAGSIGTAIESLNRTLADFKDEGLIDILDSGIVLRDRKRLKNL